MGITLKFIGALRNYSGAEKITLNCKKGVSLIELIKEVTKKAPVLRRNLLNDQLEQPMPNSLILINGREISVLDGLESKVNDGDEIVFIPVVHGG